MSLLLANLGADDPAVHRENERSPIRTPPVPAPGRSANGASADPGNSTERTGPPVGGVGGIDYA